MLITNLRRSLFLTILLLSYTACLPVEANDIWGVWNPDQLSSNIEDFIPESGERFIYFTTTDGTFKVDWYTYHIVVDSDLNGKEPRILYDGGGYTIIQIIESTRNTVSIYIEEQQGTAEDGWMSVNAKIIFHYLQDHKY